MVQKKVIGPRQAFIKENIKRMVTSYCFPLMIFGVLMLVFHLILPIHFGDDEYFANVLRNSATIDTWFDFMRFRYYGWSSRLVIEGALTLITHATMLWRLLDTLAVTWVAVAFSIFFNPEKRSSVNWFIVYAVFTFPLHMMASAGWIATTLNYYWPLAFGLLALLPICDTLRKKRTAVPVCILSMFALIYAVNQEQMCAVMLAVCGLSLVYLYVRDKKMYRFIVCEVLICLGSMVFILMCPGNGARKISETGTWFPEYANLSLLTKLEMGYSSSLYEIIMKSNLVFSLLCIVLTAAVFCRSKKHICQAISVIPLAASVIMGTFADVFSLILPNLTALRDRMTETGTGFQLTNVYTWIPEAFITCVLLSVLAGLCFAFEDIKESLFAACLLLTGLASRCVMGFSPTIWVSSERTCTFMYFSLIAVSIMLFHRVAQNAEKDKGSYRVISVGIGIHIIFILEYWLNCLALAGIYF